MPDSAATFRNVATGPVNVRSCEPVRRHAGNLGQTQVTGLQDAVVEHAQLTPAPETVGTLGVNVIVAPTTHGEMPVAFMVTVMAPEAIAIEAT